MCYNVTADVLAIEKSIPATVKFVLVVLAVHADPDSQEAWPSIALLAKETGLSRSTVTASLAYLRRSGLVKQIKRGSKQNGSSKYRLEVPKRKKRQFDKVESSVSGFHLSDIEKSFGGQENG